MFGRDSEKKRKKSKYNRHQRVVAQLAKRLGHKGFVHPSVYSATWDSSKQRAIPGWQAKVKSLVKRGGGKTAHRGGKRGKRRSSGGGLDSFSGLDAFLTRLLGGVKKVLSPRLRPSESLAQRKVRLQQLINKMGDGINALKERERIEDMTRAQYKSHVEELKRMKKAMDDLKKAWREAHRKQGKRASSSELPRDWNEHEPYGGGPGDWGGFMGGVRDPQRKLKAKKKGGKKKGGKKRVSAATRKRMKAAAKRRWAAIRRYRAKGMSLRSARAAAKREKAGKKPAKKRPAKAKKKAAKKRSGRDYGYGSF